MPDKDVTDADRIKNLDAIRYVRPWLKHANINNRQLADILHMSESQISKWLNGKISPLLSHLDDIARAIGITVQVLLSRSPGSGVLGEDSSEIAHDAEEVALLRLWRIMPQPARASMLSFLVATYEHGSKVA